MNCLDYFWNEYEAERARRKEMGAVPGQMDLFEGVYCTCDVDMFGFGKEFESALVTDISLRAEGYNLKSRGIIHRSRGDLV